MTRDLDHLDDALRLHAERAQALRAHLAALHDLAYTKRQGERLGSSNTDQSATGIDLDAYGPKARAAWHDLEKEVREADRALQACAVRIAKLLLDGEVDHDLRGTLVTAEERARLDAAKRRREQRGESLRPAEHQPAHPKGRGRG